MPNILITGTPGTGKTSLARSIIREHPELIYLNISDLVKQEKFYEDTGDDTGDSLIIDEEKLLDHIEDVLLIDTQRNFLVDFHSPEIFPERWFDLVVVLRTNNEILYNRLSERGYSKDKIDVNIDAEIFGVVAEAANESYHQKILRFFDSDTIEQMENNECMIEEWLKNWRVGDSPAPSKTGYYNYTQECEDF